MFLQSPSKGARDSFLGTSLPTNTSASSSCCKCLASTFENTPSPNHFFTSHTLSRGWLLSFRLISALYLFTIFVFTWTGLGPLGEGWHAVWYSSPDRYSDDWEASNIPPVYLTNWGFLSSTVYFIAVTGKSIVG